MRLCFCAAATSLLLVGCSTTTYREPVWGVALTRGSIEMFSALVPGSSGMPACDAPAHPGIGGGERAVALVYAGPMRQQITVLLDQAGVPKAYIDVRTNPPAPEGTAADRTAIALYLEQGYAVLANYPRSGRPVILEVPLDQAYSSERLGNPSAALQRVLAMCGEPV